MAEEPLSVELRARNRRDQAYSVSLSKRAIDLLMEAEGSRGLYEGNRTQRGFRDIHVEEFFYVIEGRGTHLVEGGEVAMGPGDIVFTSPSVWLGFRNPHDLPLRALFGYFGASSLEEGGYEVHKRRTMLGEPTSDNNIGD